MICISPKKTARFLTWIVLGIATSSLITQFFKIVLNRPDLFGFTDLFNLDNEANIPAWYSSYALLFCSLLLGIITWDKYQAGDRFTLHWGGLSLIFALLSLDEAVGLHENWLPSVLSRFQDINYNWMILGVGFVGAIALLYLRFLMALPAGTRWLIILAGTIFISGALGIEYINTQHANSYGEENMVYALLVFFEELLEMLGVVVLIYALLSYIATDIKTIYIDSAK